MGTERPQSQMPRMLRGQRLAWLVAGSIVIIGVAWMWRGRESSTQKPSELESKRQRTATPGEIAHWTQKARQYELENDLVKAAAVYREALNSHLPETVAMRLRHRRIEVLILLGDASGARQELRRIREADLSRFDHVRVLVHEARLSRLEGHPQRALSFLEKALPELRYALDAVCERGILYLDLGRLNDAVRDLSQVVEAVPNHEIAHFKLAEAYRRLRRPREAERHRRAYERLHRAALQETLSNQPGKEH
jgi:tetratricopeptide (TPR) repeat protein